MKAFELFENDEDGKARKAFGSALKELAQKTFMNIGAKFGSIQKLKDLNLKDTGKYYEDYIPKGFTEETEFKTSHVTIRGEMGKINVALWIIPTLKNGTAGQPRKIAGMSISNYDN
jgi:hypothetical protein